MEVLELGTEQELPKIETSAWSHPLCSSEDNMSSSPMINVLRSVLGELAAMIFSLQPEYVSARVDESGVATVYISKTLVGKTYSIYEDSEALLLIREDEPDTIVERARRYAEQNNMRLIGRVRVLSSGCLEFKPDVPARQLVGYAILNKRVICLSKKSKDDAARRIIELLA